MLKGQLEKLSDGPNMFLKKSPTVWAGRENILNDWEPADSIP